jgi:hypothetical protein
MMLELAQYIQVFLHKHDRPPVSLYEEMVERQRAEERREREREEKERQLSRIKEEEQVLHIHVATVSGGSQLEPGSWSRHIHVYCGLGVKRTRVGIMNAILYVHAHVYLGKCIVLTLEI